MLVAESRYAQPHTVCDKAKVLRRGSAFLRNVESVCGGVEGSLHWFVVEKWVVVVASNSVGCSVRLASRFQVYPPRDRGVSQLFRCLPFSPPSSKGDRNCAFS